MKYKTIKDFKDLPAGSILHEIKENKLTFRCLHKENLNNITRITLPKDICANISINPLLAKQKKLTNKRRDKIIELRVLQQEIFYGMKNCPEDQLPSFAKKLEQVEYGLQKQWKFRKNKNFHCWWDVPRCTCPMWDNRDSYGTKYRNISSDCPVHGL